MLNSRTMTSILGSLLLEAVIILGRFRYLTITQWVPQQAFSTIPAIQVVPFFGNEKRLRWNWQSALCFRSHFSSWEVCRSGVFAERRCVKTRDNRTLIRSGEAPAVGWSRNVLYSGFNNLLRSVFWSANFNGRSDNLDVICLRRCIIVARTTCSMNAICRFRFTSVDCKDLL